MATDLISSISIKLSDEVYKLVSIVRGDDKSFYFAFPTSAIASSIDKEMNNLKFSYHPSGKNHMKVKRGEQTITVPFPDKPMLSKVKGMMNTKFVISLFDVKTINSNKHLLDKSKSKSKYETKFVIEAKDYEHLALRFYLSEMGYFDIKKVNQPFKQILQIGLKDLELIVVATDEWLGEKQVAQQSI